MNSSSSGTGGGSTGSAMVGSPGGMSGSGERGATGAPTFSSRGLATQRAGPISLDRSNLKNTAHSPSLRFQEMGKQPMFNMEQKAVKFSSQTNKVEIKTNKGSKINTFKSLEQRQTGRAESKPAPHIETHSKENKPEAVIAHSKPIREIHQQHDNAALSKVRNEIFQITIQQPSTEHFVTRPQTEIVGASHRAQVGFLEKRTGAREIKTFAKAQERFQTLKDAKVQKRATQPQVQALKAEATNITTQIREAIKVKTEARQHVKTQALPELKTQIQTQMSPTLQREIATQVETKLSQEVAIMTRTEQSTQTQTKIDIKAKMKAITHTITETMVKKVSERKIKIQRKKVDFKNPEEPEKGVFIEDKAATEARRTAAINAFEMASKKGEGNVTQIVLARDVVSLLGNMSAEAESHSIRGVRDEKDGSIPKFMSELARRGAIHSRREMKEVLSEILKKHPGTKLVKESGNTEKLIRQQAQDVHHGKQIFDAVSSDKNEVVRVAFTNRTTTTPEVLISEMEQAA